ncbi:uncharacterized protein LOC123886266 [Trifolium pratense]|uniref:uncharacterized protein LOC123886266 n=1 Tax=Trifolium pratense TaxID=57577 RepID=UPI001E692BBF|nr:uncharacterized protein LOC123886266 [Trifolium pratense]
MFALGWGEGGEAWVWRRHLRVWEEEMLGECQSLLLNIFLQAHSIDRWEWRSDPVTGYSVRGAYQLLITSHTSVTTDVADNLIWHSQVPLKLMVAFLDVERLSRPITYSFPAALLVLFGI